MKCDVHGVEGCEAQGCAIWKGCTCGDDSHHGSREHHRTTKLFTTTEDKLALIEIASLVTQSEIPKSYVELGGLLWQAFMLGKKYRDAGGKE